MANRKRDERHRWKFRMRFRMNSFGWRSSRLAVQRVKEAVSEIKKVVKNDPVVAAEGAVLFLEKVSPALSAVDSSSGSLGTAVNNAVESLVSIIAGAPADDRQRDGWMERLWLAVEEDEMPYIEPLTDHWGELCASRQRASHWADDFIETVREVWCSTFQPGGYFKGTTACLSSLFAAGRNEEVLGLLRRAPHRMWCYRKWGVRALMAMGRKAEALRYAEESRGLNEPDSLISETCEGILLSSGMAEEAYRRYALSANLKTTGLATFRAIVRKYSRMEPAVILQDLVESTPGEEGRWFAAARSAGLYQEAIQLANRSSCDPRTLARAARDMAETEPWFALESGVAALRWMVEGYGYEITGRDVQDAYDRTMAAAKNAGCVPETLERVRRLVAGRNLEEQFAGRILLRHLGLRPLTG